MRPSRSYNFYGGRELPTLRDDTRLTTQQRAGATRREAVSQSDPCIAASGQGLRALRSAAGCSLVAPVRRHNSFPDFPDANAVGDDETDALTQAVDALEVALEVYFEDRRPIPAPSDAAPGQRTVALSARATAKALLWNEMFAQKLRKADLARKLDVSAPQVDRLFELGHASKIAFVEQAAKALGKRLEVSLV